jgi:hypothetical protein
MGLGSSRGRPRSSWKRPRRAPKMYVEMSEVVPPVTWTTPDPAKSMAPHPNSGAFEKTLMNPLLLQTLWTVTG